MQTLWQNNIVGDYLPCWSGLRPSFLFRDLALSLVHTYSAFHVSVVRALVKIIANKKLPYVAKPRRKSEKEQMIELV